MRRGAAGAFAAAALLLPGPPAVAQAEAAAPVVVLREAMSYERALEDPLYRAVAGHGGMGMLTHGSDLDVGAVVRDAARRGAVLLREGPLPLSEALAGAGPGELVVLVVSVRPTVEMLAAGDDVTPVALGRGTAEELAVPCSNLAEAGGGAIEALPGCMTGLTSDTTRREGLVADVDLAPTILDLAGLPPGGPGTPMRATEEPAPSELHRRYLGYRRVHTPVGLVPLGAVLLGLAAGLAALFLRPRERWVRRAAWGGLGAIAMSVALLPASLLPSFTWATVLPAMVGGGALLAYAAVRLGRGDPAAPVAVVAGAGACLVVLDGLLGWRALLMPLIGGSSLEGVRFYGLGNGFGGMLAAGSVLVAARLRPWAGAALLGVAGMLAGLPRMGANLGVALTLFAAAGIWVALRGSPIRLPARVAVAVLLAAGLVSLLLWAHRTADLPTHVTAALEGGSALGTFAERLALNVRNTSASPAGWLAVAALPVGLAVAWRRLGPFGPSLRADPAWRDGVVTLALASMVGFLVNDTIGVAGMGFVFLAAALVYPALERRWTSG